MNRKRCLLCITGWILFSSILISISCGKVSALEDIYGIWKGTYFGKELLIEFYNDDTCLLSFRNIDSNLIETLNGNFVMDFSKNPIPLSIRNIPQLNHPLHTIVEFAGFDSIKLGKFSPHWKVMDISFEQRESVILGRLKSN